MHPYFRKRGKEEKSHFASVFYAILVILHPLFRGDARSASSSVPFHRARPGPGLEGGLEGGLD